MDFSHMSLFSASSLRTLQGSSLAIALLVQLLKNLPFIKKIPTRWLAVIIGELLFVVLMPSVPKTIADWVSLFLNGILSSSAAIGVWHLIQQVVPSMKANQKGE